MTTTTNKRLIKTIYLPMVNEVIIVPDNTLDVKCDFSHIDGKVEYKKFLQTAVSYFKQHGIDKKHNIDLDSAVRNEYIKHPWLLDV